MEKCIDISGEGIKGLIRDFITSSSSNTMRNDANEPAWDSVLVGFASGADQIW